MVSGSFVWGYLLGGLTFFPVIVFMTWILYIIYSHAIYPIYGQFSRQKKKGKASPVKEQPMMNGQLYKVGWLSVQQDRIAGDDDGSTIGDIVVSYISGNNHQPNNPSYFSVLKYNTLYLYDSEKQLDCKQVIGLNEYKVSIHPAGLEDFELFSKTQHIQLENKDQKKYYINCKLCIEKEDWFFAFIRASKTTLPLVQVAQDSTHFEQTDMNHLINTIHSNEHHFQTQWFNALFGRLFLSVYKTSEVQEAFYRKIVSKLDKINAKRPPFLGEMTVRSVDPGHAVPRITHPKLLSISPGGELAAEAHLDYDGSVRIEIETVLKWKYLDRVKPLTIDIVLAVTLEAMSGPVQVKIKAPPTNRFWYAFDAPPEMKWKVEPVVWDKRVGYSVVVKAIETKIEEFIGETMVLPHWDDIVFFPTEKGGIFSLEKKHQADQDLLSSAKSLPELFQQRDRPLDPYPPLPSSPPEDSSLLSSSSASVSSLDDSLQTTDHSLFDMQPSCSTSSDSCSHVRLRKSSSIALLNSPKTSPSTAVNVVPALAHREKKESIDQGTLESL
ncbi:putative integral membrane protein conserved region-domain-containing protein [Sporodiniella umbellata]|nr:putative integral membrane protein conserved region-domain-containing protein [Sporodiniella umbellata]